MNDANTSGRCTLHNGIMNKILTFAILVITITSCDNRNNSTDSSRELIPNPEEQKKDTFILAKTDTTKKTTTSINKYFPFELQEIEGRYQIVAQIEEPDLYPKYYNLFKKYGYEGNGVCWEGHITQILEKLDIELIKHINFDSEAGSFFAIADTKNNQLKFVEILSPIFSDIDKLEGWVKKANRSRIDD
jgi:Immunity protein 51